jgi:hypothetical protein
MSGSRFSTGDRELAVLQRLLRDWGLPLTGRSSLHNLRILMDGRVYPGKP